MAGMSTSTFRRFFGLLGWILLVPSALTALGAAWLLASGMNILGDTHTAKGRVVAHEEIMTGAAHRRGLAKKSIVEFAAGDGRRFRFTHPAQDPPQAEISSPAAVKIVAGTVMLLSSAIGMALGWLLLRLRPRSVA